MNPTKGAITKYGPITTGGNFTIFKVREKLNGYEDTGLYDAPKGIFAMQATPEELKHDGITP